MLVEEHCIANESSFVNDQGQLSGRLFQPVTALFAHFFITEKFLKVSTSDRVIERSNISGQYRKGKF